MRNSEISRRTALLAGALALASACKKTENDWPVTPVRPYTYSDFSARLPEYMCDRLMRCPDAASTVLLSRTLFQSATRCTDLLTQAMARPGGYDTRGAIAAGRVVFHDDAAHAYLDDLAGPCDSSGIEYDLSAGGTLEGTVAEGGACTSLVECKPGTYCSHDGGACPGTCQKTKSIGDQCGSGEVCGSNNCSGGICSKPTVTAPAASGEPCGLLSSSDTTETRCAPDLFCQGTPSGVCRSEIPGDAPCSSENDVCVLGHLCMTDVDGVKRCRPVAVSQKGEICTNETNPDLTLCDSFSNLLCDQGTCTSVASGTEGSRCVHTYLTDSCNTGLHCGSTSGVCERLGQAGEPCSEAEQCKSHWCISASGTCSAEPCQ